MGRKPSRRSTTTPIAGRPAPTAATVRRRAVPGHDRARLPRWRLKRPPYQVVAVLGCRRIPPGRRGRPPSPGYQFLMLVLCLYTLGVLAVQAAVRLAPETRSILDYADYAVCMIFVVDFMIDLVRAPNWWRYFVTWGGSTYFRRSRPSTWSVGRE